VAYIAPDEVISPKALWRLVDVVLNKGPGEPAYAIGMWDRHRRIGFRWNGDHKNPLGNPQSRGLPTWVILDPALNSAVLKLVEKDNPSKAAILRAFLGRPIDNGT
jgi:hypothetical protein